jgi:glycosyltransferase involved in cell wall biosynthesis
MMERNPLVSIIVRTKDRPKLLENALRSIADQTYRPIEVVLVNDGGCVLVIEQLSNILKDVTLNYIRLEKNTGRAHAGNVGIENAQGEYIGFLDDDDELYCDHLSVLTDGMRNQKCKIVYSDANIVYRYSQGCTVEEVTPPKKIFSSKDFSYNALLLDNYIPLMCLLFSKEIFEDTQGFDEEFQIYEDWDMLIRSAEKYPFHHIKKTTAEYVQWSTTRQVAQTPDFAKEAMEAHKQIIDKHRNKFTADIIAAFVQIIRQSSMSYETFVSLEKRLGEKETHISRLNDLIRQKQEELEDKQREIEQKEEEIIGLRSHLNKICHSRGWKVISKYYRFRDNILPDNSRRRLFYELLLIAGERPKEVLNKINKYNLKRFFRQYKNLEPSALESKVKGKISCSIPTGAVSGRDGGDANFEDNIFLNNFRNLTVPREKNRILIIDRWLPTYDQDSGSLRMFSLLKILRSLGYKVTFLPDDLQKKEPYASELQSIGVEVLYGIVDIEKYLENMGGVFSFVLLSRPEQTFKYISLVRAYAINSVVLYDTVDLHWIRFARAASLHEDRELSQRAKYFRSMEMFNALCCDVVLAVTDSDKESLLNDLPELQIEIVPNIHDVVGKRRPFKERKDIMFIGNFFHQPNEDAVFFFVKEIFPMLQEKLPQLRFIIVGSDPSALLLKLASRNIEVTGYVKDVAPYFETCRVFVSPLRYGAGMKGKIGQSMAFGLPVVTTTVGAEGIGLIGNENALIADAAGDFADAVLRLYTDENLWERISLNSVSHIEKNYSAEVVKEKVARLFNSVKSHEI